MNAISAKIRDEANRIKRLNKTASVFSTILLPIVIALIIDNSEAFQKASAPAFWVALAVMVTLQAFLAYALISESPLAVEIYPDLVSSKEAANRLQDENEKFKSEILAAQTHIEAVYQWIKMEHIYSAEQKGQNIPEIVSEIMSIVVEERENLFGFKRDERWNFALYLFDSSSQLLEPIWRDHHKDLVTTGGLGRKWPIAEGHIGLAFAQKIVQVMQDATVPEIAGLVQGKGDRYLSTDAGNYRSFASIPLC